MQAYLMRAYLKMSHTARGPAGGYFASLGNLILNGELGIGEGKVKQGDKLLKLLNPLDILGTGGNMRDIIVHTPPTLDLPWAGKHGTLRIDAPS